MKVNNGSSTIQVSFRLERDLVERMRVLCATQTWPPPPSQTEIVERGIRMVLDNLEPPSKRRARSRAQA